MSDTQKTATKTASATLDSFAATQRQSLDAMTALHSRVLQSAVSMNVEMMDFARQRFGADLATSSKLYGCRSVPESMQALSDHVRVAVQDYSDQAARLMQIGLGAAETKTTAETEGSKPTRTS
ncbi:MAG: phasin family protein [Pseudomonadota bacterium]